MIPEASAILASGEEENPPMTLEELKNAVILAIQREVARLLEIQQRLERTNLTGPDFELDTVLRQQLTYLGVTLNTLLLVHANSIWEILPLKEWKPRHIHPLTEGAD